MDRQLIVEVLDRRGHVAGRHRLETLPATLGRGYGCAVILDDRFVSPEHLRIDVDESGEVVAVDLDSLNGLREPSTRQKVSRIPIRAGTRILVGQTVLRFCFPDQQVPPAVPERAETLEIGPVTLTPAGGLAVGAIAATWVGVATYLDSFGPERSATGVAAFIGTGIVLAVWAGIWALLGRLLVHRPRFGLHVGLAGLATLATALMASVAAYGDFLAPGGSVMDGIEGGVGLFVFGALIAGSLALSTALSRVKRLTIGFGVSILVAGLVGLAVVGFDRDAGRAARFHGTIKPFGQSWVRVTTPDSFFAGLEQLVSEVDELAAERGETQPADSPADSSALE